LLEQSARLDAMALSGALIASASGAMLTVFMFGWTNGAMNSPALVMRAALDLTHNAAVPERDVVWGW
jgi:hypothetical protein